MYISPQVFQTMAVTVLATCMTTAWAAAPQFDRVFDSHMVLPHGKPLTISGTADGKDKVSVTFAGKTQTATPDAKGQWSVKFPALEPNSKGQTLTATQKGETTTLDDILIGEVWLASGQSNMLFRLNQCAEGKEDIANSANEQLRLLNSVPQVHTNAQAYNDDNFSKLTPEGFYTGTWAVSSPSSSGPCSAVAYYFGQGLQKGLDMPVGIIHSSLGGSEMVAWLPPTVINGKSEYSSCRGNNWLDSKIISDWVRGRAKQNIGSKLSSGEPNHPYKPAFLYESGIEWVTKLPISGILWYQGESDAEINDSKQNSMQLGDLIDSWRQAFGDPNLPFVQIQLPRINDKGAIRAYWPEFREVQAYQSKAKPNVLTINTIDLGSTDSNVHPNHKTQVGERAANATLAKVYGKDVPAPGPGFKQAKVKGKEVFVSFTSNKLKTSDGEAPKHFEVAGADGEFHPADAKIAPKGYIVVSSSDVTAPKYVRYCWATFVEPNLVDEEGLPAEAFRTDHQDILPPIAKPRAKKK